MSTKHVIRTLSSGFLLVFYTFTTLYAGSEDTGTFLKRGIASVEERRILVSLQQEKEKVEEREKKLDAREFELKTLAQEVDKKLQEIKVQRKFLEELLTARDEARQKQLRSLSKIYEKMDPVKAAAILNELDDDLAIGVLEGMKSKSAGKLLSQLERDKAARLSVYFTLYQEN